jgi:hypothetical protein
VAWFFGFGVVAFVSGALLALFTSGTPNSLGDALFWGGACALVLGVIYVVWRDLVVRH